MGHAIRLNFEIPIHQVKRSQGIDPLRSVCTFHTQIGLFNRKDAIAVTVRLSLANALLRSFGVQALACSSIRGKITDKLKFELQTLTPMLKLGSIGRGVPLPNI